MSIPLFLGMTAAEIRNCSALPSHLAWMSVHFSMSGDGITNIPSSLPDGSLIILDDQTPWGGHSAEKVCTQMVSLLTQFHAYGLLLDFERPLTPQTLLLTKALSVCCKELNLPMAAPKAYAEDLDIDVFMPPLSCLSPADTLYLPGKKIWLDASPTASLLHITEHYTESRGDFPSSKDPSKVFSDPTLGCKYYSEPARDGVLVHLYHTPETISRILQELSPEKVPLAIGLWKEYAQ